MYLAVTVLSLLAGASVVHNIYKPDMVSDRHRASHTLQLDACALPSLLIRSVGCARTGRAADPA